MKKNKFLIVIISILFLVLAFLGVLILKNSKHNAEKDIKKENASIRSDIISIAEKSDNKIYFLTDSGNDIELMDISEYSNVIYTYYNGKLYLYLHTSIPGKINLETHEVIKESENYNTLGYIDLTSNNYSFKKLSDVNAEGAPESIAVVDDTIYYTSTAFKGIYEYNINTKTNIKNSTVVNDFDFNVEYGVQLYNLSKSKLVYFTNSSLNKSPTVGVIDIKNGYKKVISTNGNFEYVYDGKVIYRQYDIEKNYSKWKYYEYNVDEDTSNLISDSTSSVSSIYTSYIIPIDNYYIYANGNILNKYSNGINEKVYEFDGGVDNITKVSKNTLNILYGGTPYDKSKYINFDLDTKEVKINSDNVSYIWVLYVK